MQIEFLGPKKLLDLSARSARTCKVIKLPPFPAKVLPFVAEQGSVGYPTGRSPISLDHAIKKVRASLRLSPPHLSTFIKHGIHETHFWGSCLSSFIEHVLPHLPKNSFVVSHGNFMRLQIACHAQESPHVPNGGVIHCRMGSRNVFFVRHCVTCHNVDKNGSAALTVCRNFDALLPLKIFIHALRNKIGDGSIGIYCSALPRAMISATYLTRGIEEYEREHLSRAFGACKVTIPHSVLADYERDWKCQRHHSKGPFCDDHNESALIKEFALDSSEP